MCVCVCVCVCVWVGVCFRTQKLLKVDMNLKYVPKTAWKIWGSHSGDAEEIHVFWNVIAGKWLQISKIILCNICN